MRKKYENIFYHRKNADLRIHLAHSVRPFGEEAQAGGRGDAAGTFGVTVRAPP